MIKPFQKSQERFVYPRYPAQQKKKKSTNAGQGNEFSKMLQGLCNLVILSLKNVFHRQVVFELSGYCDALRLLAYGNRSFNLACIKLDVSELQFIRGQEFIQQKGIFPEILKIREIFPIRDGWDVVRIKG